MANHDVKLTRECPFIIFEIFNNSSRNHVLCIHPVWDKILNIVLLMYRVILYDKDMGQMYIHKSYLT